MIGVEFNGAPAGFAGAVVQEALHKHDMFILAASVYQALRLIPPLNVTTEEALDGVERLCRSVEGVVNKWRAEGKL